MLAWEIMHALIWRSKVKEAFWGSRSTWVFKARKSYDCILHRIFLIGSSIESHEPRFLSFLIAVRRLGFLASRGPRVLTKATPFTVSPNLFISCNEIISKLLQRKDHKSALLGIKVAWEVPRITHLMFCRRYFTRSPCTDCLSSSSF